MSEWARRKGVSRQAVHKRVRNGGLSTLADGTLDPEVAEREWSVTRDQPQPPRPPTTPAPSGTSNSIGVLASARSASALVGAKLKQLDLEERVGTLVRVEEIEARWFELARALQTRMLAIPGRLCDVLAPITDSHEVRRALDAEIRSALQELATSAATATSAKPAAVDRAA
jgi:hypothetical protein